MNAENQLATIVDESGLDKSKADVLLQSFQDYFKIAGEWEQKAKVLVVTSEAQVAEMKMAREGRLFLKEKRVAMEKVRKSLKEQSLREGKAIDGIANVIKALIIPIEQHLDRQEHFVELREAEKAEALRLEVEARIVAEQRAVEQWLAAEREQVRLDNIRLRQEADKAAEEKVALEKRAAAEAEAKEREMKAEREKAAAKQREIEAKAKADREKAEKILAVEKAKKAALEAKIKAQAKAERERLATQIECPFCHKTFSLPSGVR